MYRQSGVIQKDIQDLCTSMMALTNNRTISAASMKSAVDRGEAQLAVLKAELSESNSLHQKSMFASQLGDVAGPSGFRPASSKNAAPVIDIAEEELHELFVSAKRQQPLRIELKGNNPDIGASMPAQLVPGIVSRLTEPTRIAQQLPGSAMPGPTIEYLRHISTTGTATTVAPGAIKPEVLFVTDQLVLKASKIAAVTGVTDESLQDFQGFAAYITQELTKVYIDAENLQMLLGDGTGSNMTGLLNTSGVIVRPKASDTALDALEQAGQDLRVGPSFTTPTLYVMHPVDFGGVRRAKDTQGRYLVTADPTQTETSALWGVPVIQTTQITQGTALCLNTDAAAQVWTRTGVTIDTSNGSTDDYIRNLTRFRIEARLGLAVVRPSAIVKVTGL